MSQDLTETLAKLSDRNLPKEDADALLASLKDKDLQLEMKFQRHNTTLSISAPDAYRGGQTLNGKAGQREVQVLIPETDEQATRALAYGTSLSLTVRYLEFDDFYRRVTFTGSLQDKAEKSEPVPSPEPAATEPEEDSGPEPAPEPEPEPVAESQPVTDESAPEKVESAEPAVEKEGESAIIEPPSPELPKQKTGELAVFTSPNLSASGASLAGKSSVRSSDLIATLAEQTQSTQEEVALVVDGFWDYLADVKGHYREHRPENHTLVIPHFGTFRFRFQSRNKQAFEFIPGPYDTGSRGMPSSSWVDQWSGEPGGLSVRRRISVFVAEQSGLPLKKADTLLNQLLDAVKGLFRGGATINWARRGTMRRITTRKGKEIYSFFPSPGFLERLQIPPAPKYYTSEPEQSRSPDPTEYEPEHSWEEDAPNKELDWTRHTEGEGPRSGDDKSGKPPMPAGQKTTMKASGCGCITLPIIAAVIGSGQLFKLGFFLGIVFIVLLIKRGLCHRG